MYMEIPLTPERRSTLKRLHRNTKDRRNADKIKATLLLSDGYTVAEVARILLLDDDTIRSWLKGFESSSNIGDWLANKHVPYLGKLTQEQKQEVSSFVEGNIVSDSKEVIEFIQEKFAVDYRSSGVKNLLKTLGFVYKKMSLVPSKYDPEKQAEFKAAYEELEQTLKDKEVALFMDGVHPQHNATATRAWIRKGEEKELKSNSGRQRVNWNGAYNPVNQDVLIHESKTLDADAILEMIKKIEDFYPDKDKIHIIADNARYYRNAKVSEYLETSRVEFRFMPPYSPNLNLIERLWKFMRKNVINNKYYEKFSEFRQALLDFHEGLDKRRPELKKFIGTKMQLLTPV